MVAGHLEGIQLWLSLDLRYELSEYFFGVRMQDPEYG